MSVAACVLVLLLASLSAACAGEDRGPTRVAIEVSVVDDDEERLAGAAVIIAGRDAGTTGTDRALVGATDAPPGTQIQVEVRCPRGYASIGGDTRQVVVRHLRPVGEKSGVLFPLSVEFACSTVEKRHVLVVRTNRRSGLPVVVTGVEVGRTDQDGVAHHVIEGAPGEEISVVIDTSAAPKLRPVSPTRRLALPPKDSFLVFDQDFEERRAPVVKRRVKAPPGPRRL